MTSHQAKIADAEQKLSRVLGYLHSDPGNAELLASAIDFHLLLGQIEEANIHVENAMTLFPDNPFFQHRYGNILIAQDRLDDAQNLYEQLHQESADANIAYNLAYVYFRQGQYQDAGTVLQAYIDLPSVPAEAVTLFLRVLHRQGEIKTAIEVAERNLKARSDDHDFLAVASLLYLDDGQMERARKLSIAAQTGDFSPIEAYIVGGVVTLGDGDVQGARAQFNAALKIQPSDGRSWSGLGLASLLNNDLVGATEQLERAVRYLPTHIGTLHSLGWCKILSRDLVAAETIFRKALSLDRNFSESHGGLAVVAALKGDRDLASKCIDLALRLDPRSLSAKYAQMVGSGDLNDPDRFRALALRILSTRQGPFGESLKDVLITSLGKKKKSVESQKS
jgi:tetratricopeptide (TPR) repeat protein